MSVKQIIAIRRDIKMRRGKEIAQGAHAAMAFLTDNFNEDGNLIRPFSPKEIEWITGSFTKIIVQVPNWEELARVHNIAFENNIRSRIIIDNGWTEFNNIPTATAIAIGPEDSEILNKLFDHLKLY